MQLSEFSRKEGDDHPFSQSFCPPAIPKSILFAIILLIHLFGFNTAIHAESAHIVWTQIDQPDHLQFKSIIGAVNTDSVFLLDVAGRIIEKRKDSFRILPALTNEPTSHVAPDFTSGEFLIVSVLDSAYASASFMWTGNDWEDLRLNNNAPVRRFSFSPGKTLFAAGDWGALFRRKPGGAWEAMESPSSQHLLSILVIGENEYWLGTRGEGVYHVNNGVVEHYGSQETDFVDIYQMKLMADGTLTFRTGAGKQLMIADGQILPLSHKTGLKSAYFLLPMDQGLDLFSDGQNMLIRSEDFSQTIVYRDERFLQTTFLPDGHLLALDANGQLYEGESQTGLFFHDATNRFRLAGYPAEVVQSAIFRDQTGDQLPELTILVSGSAPGMHIYAREPEAGFLEITRESGISAISNLTHIVPGDFNRDGLPDLILSSLENGELNLNRYLNLGDGRFGRGVRIIQEEQQIDRPSNLQALDLNADGRLDLLSVEYYGPREQRRGGVSYFQNRGAGKLVPNAEPFDSMLGFNLDALCMDFNNDSHLDLLLSTRWLADKLYLGGDGELILADSTFLPSGRSKTNREGGLALDLEGDGDLDLFVVNHMHGYEIWENNGQAKYKDVTEQWLSPANEEELSPIIFSAAGIDIDLDGDTDILLSVREAGGNQIVILENETSHFTIRHDAFGLSGIHPNLVLPVDIDEDGDLDLYLAAEGENRLFLNRTDRSDWLVVRPHGRKSNPDGFHAVVDLFPSKSGASVSAFKRGWVGGHLFARAPQTILAPIEARFGALKGERVDVRVRFLGGRTVWQRGQKVGNTIDVYESYSLSSLTFPWSGKALNQLRRAEVQMFLLTFILASSWLIAVVQVGRRRLGWGILWVSSLVTINQGAFWIVAILAVRSNHPLSFVAPIGFVVVGTVVPFLASWSWKRLKLLDTRRQSSTLLKQLLVFNHGEWAQNNLNSLQRLIPHYLLAPDRSQELTSQCLDRIQTWQEMTYPNLVQLLDVGRHLTNKAVVISGLRDDVNSLNTQIDTLSKVLNGEKGKIDSDSFVDTILAIRGGLKQLKQHVYRDHSSEAVAVIKNLLSLMRDSNQLSGVEVELESEQQSMWVLLPGFVLADLLDNLIRNALKAIGEQQVVGQIKFKLESLGAKTHIFVTDNGCGIEESDVDAVFLEGVSSGGGGHGLAQARDTLKEYGAGIHLHWSEPGVGTTFRLDLNEGVKRSESDATDHRR